MNGLVEVFRLGGFGMFPTLVFGLATAVVALRYALAPERRWVPLLLTLGLLTLLSGALGFTMGLIATTQYVAGAPEPLPPTVLVQGFGESLTNVALALVFTTLSALCAAVGAFRQWRQGGAAPAP